MREPLFKNTIPMAINMGPNIINAKISTRPPINSGLEGGKSNRTNCIIASIPNIIIHQAAIFVFVGRLTFSINF